LHAKKDYQTRSDIQALVISNQQLSPSYHRLYLELTGKQAVLFKHFQPGQFVELDISEVALPDRNVIPPYLLDKGDRSILLRRPFSLCSLTLSKDKIYLGIIYAVIGPGTLRMTTLQAGNHIRVIGPLGNGFTVPQGKTTAILVAGGVGAPPIQHMAITAAINHTFKQQDLFVGARTANDLPMETKHSPQGPILSELVDYDIDIHLATDDGTTGFHGFVTECLAKWLHTQTHIKPNNTIIYACGPEPMMACVAQISSDYEIDCQVSLERYMACGFNLCQGCAVECRIPGSKDTVYKMCCQDGPVFNAKNVVFRQE
jgi:dihydroorotate dehydrogenase electron transfer subunit